MKDLRRKLCGEAASSRVGRAIFGVLRVVAARTRADTLELGAAIVLKDHRCGVFTRCGPGCRDCPGVGVGLALSP